MIAQMRISPRSGLSSGARSGRACRSSPGRGIPEGFDTPFLLRGGSETHAESPSIGSERKTYFTYRHRFLDPGVCSRVGWAFSS